MESILDLSSSFDFLFSVTSLAPRLPSDEERLLELLFDGYNPSARPVINSSHTVDVAMQFSLLQIQELVCNNYPQENQTWYNYLGQITDYVYVCATRHFEL